MATVAVLNEKLGANRREFATVVDSRKAIYEAIDGLESQVDALSAKADRNEADNASLASLQADLTNKAKEARALTAKCDTLKVEQDNLLSAISERTSFEADLKAVNTELPRQVAPVAGDPVRVSVKPPTAEELSLDIGYYAQAIAISSRDRTSLRAVLSGEGQYAEFRNDRLLQAATTSNNAAIVPTNYARSFIEYLRANTVIRSLQGVRNIPLVNGNLTLPRQASTSTSYYTAEAANITPSDVTSDTIVLSAKKLTTLVPITGELLRRSDPNAAAMIRDDLAQVAGEKQDVSFIRNATAGTPYGLKYIVDNYSSAANLVNATAVASATVATTTADLGKLRLKLANGKVPTRFRYYILTPRTEQYLMDLRDGGSTGVKAFPEMERGELRGARYVTTTQIPDNLTIAALSSRTDCSEIYYVEASELLIADTPLMDLQYSDTAAYYDGSAVVSAFSKDMGVFRLMMEHDFNIRHGVSVAMLQGVDWGK